MSARTLIVIFGVAAAALAAIGAPASLVPAIAGDAVNVERATGTLWKGRLEGLSFQGVRLGDVDFYTSPFALLTGRLAADIVSSDGALSGGGALRLGPGKRLEVRNARFTFDLSGASHYGILGSPLTGTVHIETDEIRFSQTGCLSGVANVWTDVLSGPARRLNSEAFDLAGEAACREGDLVVALSGRGQEGAASLKLKISPTLDYVLIAEAEPVRTEVAEALQVLGFQRSNGVLTIGTAGAMQVGRS